MNLVIDIGNTSVKAAIFKGEKIVNKLFSFHEIKKAVEWHPIQCSIVSKTGNDNPVEEFLRTQKFKKLYFNRHLKLPIKNDYSTPETLGSDRLALMCAAYRLYPKRNILCIDTGTCITFNFLTSKGVFLGGAIAPGIEMRFKALHHFTSNLPLVMVQEAIEAFLQDAIPFIGHSTDSSIISGVINGTIEETNGMVSRYANLYRSLKVLVSGSGAHFFSKILRHKNEIYPDLQLQGLNYIIQYNS
jgi:type III pantothenate kinase